MAQDVALAKAPVPVLGKGRMVRDLAIQAKLAKPAIREIEMNLLTQAALGPYSHAIADDHHAAGPCSAARAGSASGRWDAGPLVVRRSTEAADLLASRCCWQ